MSSFSNATQTVTRPKSKITALSAALIKSNQICSEQNSAQLLQQHVLKVNKLIAIKNVIIWHS